MKSNSILFSEKDVLFKYNTKNDNYEWDLEFEYNVYGIVRIDNYVFVTTYSNWGKMFTSLVDFTTGEKIWTKEIYLYSIHIIDGLLIYVNKKKKYCGLELLTGNEIFSTKSPFRWSTPKAIVFESNFYLHTKKETQRLNLKSGGFVKTKFPPKIQTRDLGIVLDQFQININNIPAPSDNSASYTSDAGVTYVGGEV